MQTSLRLLQNNVYHRSDGAMASIASDGYVLYKYRIKV